MKKLITALTGLLLLTVFVVGPRVAAQDVRRSLSNVARLGVADGTAATPGIYGSVSTSGYGFVQGNPAISNGSVFQLGVFSGQVQLRTDTLLGWATTNVNTVSDTFLGRAGGAGKLVLTGTTPAFLFGGTTASSPAIYLTTSGLRSRLADNSADTFFVASTLYSSGAQISSPGTSTGVAPQDNGYIYHTGFNIVVTSPAFTCAALTCDVTVATIPAKTILIGAYANLSTPFACASVCTTSTLSLTMGSSAGGTDILLTFDADAAATQRGLADADLGTALARATATQGGKMFSFASTTPLSIRLTSGTGNIGTGAASNLSQGSITIYLVTERLP